MRTVPHATRRSAPRAVQAGVAAALLLVILVMGSLYALLSGVNTATAELDRKRDDATAAALRQAKEALIAYAAMRPTRPGALPCPDLDNNGIAGGAGVYGSNSELIPGGIHGGFNCPDAGRQIGRLPWTTLALPDLRDASGERLWYVMSGNFRNDGSQVVSSDTLGQLSLGGVAPAAGVVAIIFSPGTALAGAGQNRSGAGVNDVVQYLEGGNSDLDVNFVAAQRCEQAAPACPLGPFNDQFVTITHQELFDAVENVVEKRLVTEIGPLLRFYRDRWAALGGPGFYPFAVPFMNPGQPGGMVPAPTAFCGTPGQANGLLPITSACFAWDPAAATVAETGFPSGFFVGGGCVSAPAGEPDNVRIAALKCTITYTGGSPSIAITIPTLQNAGATLTVSEQATIRFGTPADLPPYSGAPWGALAATGIAGADITVGYSGNLPPAGGPTTATITIPVYAAQTRFQQPPNNVDTSWFFNNEWYRNTYYAVVPQRLPGGAGACTPGVDCLTVVNAPATNNDKQVVLLLAGRPINGIVRPTAILADYFEGENDEAAALPAAPGTFVRQLRSNTFNDKVVVVAPCAPPGPSPCP